MNIHNSIFTYVKKSRVVTSSEIAKEFKINWNTAERYLLEMMAEQRLIRIKKSGVNLWLVK